MLGPWAIITGYRPLGDMKFQGTPKTDMLGACLMFWGSEFNTMGEIVQMGVTGYNKSHRFNEEDK